MFYDLNLDDRSYREIEADAVFRIPKEYSEWTNYNPSDPGVMLVQLFSWLTEAQQYHLSRLSIWKRLKYLRLLGVEIRHMSPARGAVCIEPGLEQIGKELRLLKGTRFYAGDMAFETAEPERLHPAKLIGAYMLQGKSLRRYHNIGNDFEKQIKLYPFGELPRIGNQCYFVLDKGLHENCPEEEYKDQGYRTDIYFDICTVYEVERNPVEDDFIPLAKLKWEYLCADGWEALEVEFDHTHEFLQSGRIRFRMKKKMVMEEQLGVFQIRVTLEENDYDVAPLIQNIYLNEIELKQQYSICDYEDYDILLQDEKYMSPEPGFRQPGHDTRVLTLRSSLALAGTGKIELYLKKEESWILAEGVHRSIMEAGDIQVSFDRPDWAEGNLTCRLTAWEEDFGEQRILGIGDAFANQEYGLNIPDILYDDFEIMVNDGEEGVFVAYHKVEDFDNCTPEEPAYILNLEEQKLFFGNCENGMAPEGEIRVVRLRTSLGKSGNIKAGKIRECESFPGLLVKQYKNTGDGRDDETLDQCFSRFRREWKKINRGVTYSDYEELVRKTPGLLILNSRVICPSEWGKEGEALPENQISIVVQTQSYEKRNVCLSEKYRMNLEQMLQKKKMLGTSIRILDPEYIGITVYAEIAVRPQFQDAEARIEEAVKAYLDETSWEIGSPVLCSTIYGIIDTLPCVWQVRSLSVNAIGNGCRHLVNGDVALPPNGLAYLRELDVSIRFQEPEF